jgi:hypothetical protein
VAALAAVQPQEAVGQDGALEEGVELVFDERGNSAPVLASVWAMKLAARCCTRRYSVACSGRCVHGGAQRELERRLPVPAAEGLQRVPGYESDRQHQGGEIGTADVGAG